MGAETGSAMTTYFRVCDGVRVRFTDTTASDVTLLLLAPWPESRWAFRRIWDRLAAVGRVVASDVASLTIGGGAVHFPIEAGGALKEVIETASRTCASSTRGPTSATPSRRSRRETVSPRFTRTTSACTTSGASPSRHGSCGTTPSRTRSVICDDSCVREPTLCAVSAASGCSPQHRLSASASALTLGGRPYRRFHGDQRRSPWSTVVIARLLA